MQISHKHRFIFYSFPKTGSESVRELLAPYSDIHGIPFWKRTAQNPFYSHISPVEVRAIFDAYGWPFADYYGFTFVRNPWARMVSLYNMIHHTKPPRSFIGKLRNRLKPVPDFKSWLASTSPDGRGAGGPEDQRWQVYGAYSLKNYILDEQGAELVNEVIKLEEIDRSMPATLQRIGIPDADRLEIQFVNSRTSKKYSDYYDDDTRKLIEERYQYEIDRFEYRFDDIN